MFFVVIKKINYLKRHVQNKLNSDHQISVTLYFYNRRKPTHIVLSFVLYFMSQTANKPLEDSKRNTFSSSLVPCVLSPIEENTRWLEFAVMEIYMPVDRLDSSQGAIFCPFWARQSTCSTSIFADVKRIFMHCNGKKLKCVVRRCLAMMKEKGEDL